MDINRILSDLKSERDRLDRAIAALEGGRGATGRATRGPGRPAANGRRRRRHMSAEARRRISEAMRKRWAERRKKAS